ncbi:hypothetical protein DN062_10275 [Nitrincola tibetensis]|uniref:DUF4131 domain-containing protein n=1 Tax=Nitrincola tibetensis TaxID=2219697 RepID=A0A364NM96_9GAMM|nr:hypothetical protein [Nitrincola tibetensis]RAU18154.1 hypothetical protein DN062_10275 [Nitrincola tibetensis]
MEKNFKNAFWGLIIICYYPFFIQIAYITKNDLIVSHFIFIILSFLAVKYIAASYKMNQNHYEFQKHKNLNPLNRALSWCVVIPVMALILAFPAYNSIPNLLHQITKETGEIVVTVKSKEHNTKGGYKNSKRCYGYTLIINEFVPPFNQFCVYKPTYDSIMPGDSLRLVGKVSRFGFSYQELYLDN